MRYYNIRGERQRFRETVEKYCVCDKIADKVSAVGLSEDDCIYVVVILLLRVYLYNGHVVVIRRLYNILYTI